MNRDTRRTRVILALLLLTSFTLVTLDFRGGDGGPVASLRRAAGDVFGPVEEGAAAVARPVSNLVDKVRGLGENEKTIKQLQEENDALRLQTRTSELARNRAAELDKLLRVSSVGQYKVLPAQVIALGPAQDFAWTATIDAGSRDGLRPDLTVVNGDGLVGRVKTVNLRTATVLLAIDPDSTVGIRMERSMDWGFAHGRGRSPMSLELLDPQRAVTKGDRLVTRGGAVFAAGIPVGEIASVKSTPGANTKQATIKPYVDFTALDLVGVVVEPPRKDPRDAVLPPPPKPRPTPTVTVTVTATPNPNSPASQG